MPRAVRATEAIKTGGYDPTHEHELWFKLLYIMELFGEMCLKSVMSLSQFRSPVNVVLPTYLADISCY